MIQARQMVRALLALALGVLCALLVSCGGSGKGLIPAADAGPLRGDFEAISQAAKVGNGSCSATTKDIEKAQKDFESLPSSVDQGLRTRLSEGLANLRIRALEECEQPQAPATTQTTQTTDTTTTTQATQTATTTTQTATTTNTAPTPPAPSTTQTAPLPGGGTPVPEETPPGPGTGNGGGTGAGENQSGESGAPGRGPNGEGPPGQREGDQ